LYFYYRIFGLTLETQLECPELIPAGEDFAEPDVSVRFGRTPHCLDAPLMSGNWFEGACRTMLLRIDGVARYLIENGKNITVEPVADTSAGDIRLFLLGSAMGAILHQRNILPFHGSTVCSGGQAYTFSGKSGTGKSTLAAALIKRGCGLLADDVSAIALPENGRPEVHPGTPQLKLCTDVLQALDADMSGMQSLGELTGKYGYSGHDAYVGKPVPSRNIFILGQHAENRFETIPLRGMNKFTALQANTYRPFFVKAMGLEQIHFELLQKLAAGVNVYLLMRPKAELRIDELAGYVGQLINGSEK
jgi:hypothetical protein